MKHGLLYQHNKAIGEQEIKKEKKRNKRGGSWHSNGEKGDEMPSWSYSGSSAFESKQPSIVSINSSGIDLRGRPLLSGLLLLTLFSALPTAEGVEESHPKEDKALKKLDVGSDDLIEAGVDVSPVVEVLPSVSSDIRYFKAEKEPEGKPQEDKIDAVEMEILIRENIRVDVDPRANGLSFEKGKSLIQDALVAAIKASHSGWALQRLREFNLVLPIAFVSRDSDSVGMYNAVPHIAVSGIISISWPALQRLLRSAESEFTLEMILANELRHFASAMLFMLKNVPDFPQHKPSVKSQGVNYSWTNKKERKALEEAISQGLSAFWDLPEKEVNEALNKKRGFAKMLIRVLAYKIPFIEKHIEEMRKKLTGRNRINFNAVLDSVHKAGDAFRFYQEKSLNEQRKECDSDIASLVVSLGSLGKKVFSEWNEYHRKLMHEHYYSLREQAGSNKSGMRLRI